MSGALEAAFVVLGHRSPLSFLPLHSTSPSSLFSSASCNFLVWEKDTVQSKLGVFQREREGRRGEGRTKKGESKEGRVVVCKRGVLIKQKRREQQQQKKKSLSPNRRAEGEKRDLDLFEQSPGLISDTNRPTGKLCRAEREKLRRREG